MRVKCPIQEYNGMSLAGLKPGTLNPAGGHPPSHQRYNDCIKQMPKHW